MDKSMKTLKALSLTIGAVIVATSTTVWAGEPASAPAESTTTASAPMTPAQQRTANRALRKQVYAAIGQHKEISAGNISVTAKAGAITLGGTVSEASQVDKVAEIAKGVPGVTSVTNKLAVQKPLGGM
jgi:osmotically-inducible protein OsmY